MRLVCLHAHALDDADGASWYLSKKKKRSSLWHCHPSSTQAANQASSPCPLLTPVTPSRLCAAAAGVDKASAIELDSEKLTRERAGKLIAYVEQEDCLFATETPRECMQFSSHLRLPKSTTVEKKIEIVDDIIRRLGLSSCEDTMVGGGRMRGVSGGERKRTSIGVELVTNPTILFLDEPTSGLDSYAALETVKLLKELANEGCTVLCTIHQPSSEIFNVFDKCLLLSKGRMIYGGARAEIVDYFAERGHVCPALYNPADFVLFLAQTEKEEAIVALSEAWSAHVAKGAKAKEEPAAIRRASYSVADGGKHGFGTQLKMLIQRETRSVYRNKSVHARAHTHTHMRAHERTPTADPS